VLERVDDRAMLRVEVVGLLPAQHQAVGLDTLGQLTPAEGRFRNIRFHPPGLSERGTPGEAFLRTCAGRACLSLPSGTENRT
jgi:hypothetical protein